MPGTGESVDSLPPTAESLIGEVETRGDANLAWVRTLPRELASSPVVARGPDDELIVLLIAERRPLGATRFVDDYLLLRLDAETGALRWLTVVDPGAPSSCSTRSYQSARAVASDPSDMFFLTGAFSVQLSLPDGSVAQALDERYTALVARVTLPSP